jgi:hypothetical protein
VRARLGGHRPALALRPADDLHRPGGRHVAHVQPRPDVCGQQAVPGDDRLLRDRRPATETEPAGELALVHLGVLGEPWLLGVLGDDPVERLDVLQRPAHQHGVGDALAVVGEHADPGGRVGHRAQLGQPLAAQADGDRAYREHVAVPGLAAQPPDLLHHAGGVGDRVGVGHRVHGGEPAQRGGQRPGLHGLGVLAAGLAQVGVQVHQAGQRHQAVGVELGGRARSSGGRARRDLPDHSVLDADVARLAAEDPGSPDQVLAHCCASSSSAPTAGSLPPSSR